MSLILGPRQVESLEDQISTFDRSRYKPKYGRISRIRVLFPRVSCRGSRYPYVPPHSITTSSNATASIMKDIHEARIEGPQKLMEATGWHYRQSFGPEVTARAAHDRGGQPFAEWLVLFWSNHCTVSRTKAIIGPTLPA